MKIPVQIDNRELNVSSEIDLIRPFLKSDKITPEMLAAFETVTFSNFINRREERLGKKEVIELSETMPGKHRLVDHDVTKRVGVIYHSQTIELDRAATVRQIGANSGFTEQRLNYYMDYVKEADGGYFWGVAKYYLLNVSPEDQELIRRIHAGIEKYGSVGFSNGRVFPVYDDGENVICWRWTARDGMKLEAVEFSGVWLGVNYGAQMSAPREDDGIVSLLPDTIYQAWVPASSFAGAEKDMIEKVDSIILSRPKNINELIISRHEFSKTFKMDDVLRKALNYKKEVKQMKITFGNVSKEIDATKDSFQSELQSFFVESVQGAVEPYKAATAFKADFDKAFPGVKLDELSDAMAIKQQFKTDLAVECVSMGVNAGLIKTEQIETKKTEFTGMRISDLQSLKTYYSQIAPAAAKNQFDAGDGGNDIELSGFVGQA